MSHSSYYQTLGIQVNASTQEIKKAYHNLALKHHPDKSHDSAKFNDINTAYNILVNKETRMKYDTSNHSKSERANYDTVSISAMSNIGDAYTHPCRCGNQYSVTLSELADGLNLIECDSCSLCILVTDEINFI